MELKIKELKKEKGLTLDDIAIKAGISHSYISKLCYGEKINPSLSVLIRISAALGVGIEELVNK